MISLRARTSPTLSPLVGSREGCARRLDRRATTAECTSSPKFASFDPLQFHPFTDKPSIAVLSVQTERPLCAQAVNQK
jgi:hypothetical protein